MIFISEVRPKAAHTGKGACGGERRRRRPKAAHTGKGGAGRKGTRRKSGANIRYLV